MKTITVNGNQVEWEEGMTVSSLLNKMNYTFKMLVVKLNGVLVKKEQYDTTLVPEGAEVSIIHLISGG
ncbi:MAG TPA: sulfur carrier protein ThiS [Candidatus Cloacimonadota bacterium]|nr:sulfur carrier protein ThiS [Candidatus Cloacimonadota bacterium]HOV16788.1 sulfur carrier protein ThiS [Candidatus Cloacimonadota bacterium]HQL14717.1 sulfur carrier protein ThiS [Candidatus Cloacimonadota bacterium]